MNGPNGSPDIFSLPSRFARRHRLAPLIEPRGTAVLPGYGESIGSVGVDYAGEALPIELDSGDAGLNSDPEVIS